MAPMAVEGLQTDTRNVFNAADKRTLADVTRFFFQRRLRKEELRIPARKDGHRAMAAVLTKRS